jgi:HSP20 family protein
MAEAQAQAQSDIEARPKQKVERTNESTRPGAYFQPAVDIFEAPDEIVVRADLPGVSPDALDVKLEGDELTIEGRIDPKEYDGLKPLYVEYGVGGYLRRFTLGETIEREQIKAQLQNGVLTLHLPKAERARSRRIAVEGA